MTGEELYGNKETCIDEINKIRELFGLRSSNIDDFEIMSLKLAYMICYCPKELTTVVESTMNELERRKVHRLFDADFHKKKKTA